MARDFTVKVKLDADELALLDERRPRGSSRPAYFRALLREPQKPAEVASREESLAILTAQARDGRVAAAIALERALREGEEPTPPDDEFDELKQRRRGG